MSDANENETETDKNENEIVLYEAADGIARVTMNRPRYRNAQNARMTYALDAAFQRAVDDDAVVAIVLAGAGPHFSAGHDIGTPGRDIHKPFARVATSWYPHADKPPTENLFAREQELYLGMCRRWRALPKPTLAMVQGACIAGGLALAWCCDLIVAADDAFFADPVLAMGIPGVEYFAHPHALPPRVAKELLFTGEKLPAARAAALGMVNRVVPRAALEAETLTLARRIATMPRFALALAKQAVNQAEDRMGLGDTMAAAFGLHQLAHAHNALGSPDHLAGQDPKSMAKKLK
jgi:enoyl-CoA hydratase